ncbi:MAG: FecR domain-containing protein [Pseudomonadota bacterium]
MASDKSADGRAASEIEQAALDYVQRVASGGSRKDRDTLVRFREQSKAHAAAVARAEQLQSLAEALPDLPPSLGRRLTSRLDLWWTRLTERPPLLPVAATLVAVAIASVLSITLGHQPSETAGPPVVAGPSEPSTPQRHRTRWGERRMVELPDGSRVWLDWETAISVTYGAERREVTLASGNAVFEVVARVDQPFIVSAGSSQTRVTGTQFAVSRRTPDRVEVSVLEGSVEVGTVAERRQRLVSGQLIVADETRLGPVTVRSVEELGRWREGMLVFDNRPLLDALEAIADYSRVELDTTQVVDLGERVTGVFFTDRADDALQTLILAHRLDQQFDRGRLKIRTPRPTRPSRP